MGYFESFMLPDVDSLTFECDYILCSDAEDCDGYSCANSVMRTPQLSVMQSRRSPLTYRRRRSMVSDAPAPTSQRPSTISTRIQILPQESQYYRVSANNLIHGEKPELNQNSDEAALVPRYTKYYEPEPTLVREVDSPSMIQQE